MMLSRMLCIAGAQMGLLSGAARTDPVSAAQWAPFSLVGDGGV